VLRSELLEFITGNLLRHKQIPAALGRILRAESSEAIMIDPEGAEIALRGAVAQEEENKFQGRAPPSPAILRDGVSLMGDPRDYRLAVLGSLATAAPLARPARLEPGMPGRVAIAHEVGGVAGGAVIV
jgi:hypothetical protein